MTTEVLSSVHNVLPRTAFRLRVLLAFLCCIAVGVAVPSCVIWNRSLSYQHDLAGNASEIARRATDIAEREIATSMARLEVLSNSDALKRGDLRAFYDQLMTTPNSDGTWFLLFNGERQLVNTLLPFVGPPSPPMPAWQSDMRPEVEAMLSSRQPLIGDLRWAPAAKTYAVAVYLPVIVNGDARHVLSAMIPARRLEAGLESAGLPLGWMAALFDRRGAVIACITPRGSLESVSGGERCGLHVVTRVDGQKHVTHEEADGHLVRTTVSTVAGWTAAVAIPWTIITAPAHYNFMLLAATCGMLLAIATPLVWLLAARLIASVEGLRQFALQISRRSIAIESEYNIYWDQASDGLFVVSWTSASGFRLDAANRVYEQIHGKRLEHLIGKHPWHGMPGHEAVKAHRFFEKCLLTRSQQHYEQVVTSYGIMHKCEVKLSLVPDSIKPTKTIILGRLCEVSDYRKAQEALHKLTGQLLNLQDEERRRLSRELHDNTSQLLLAASLAAARVKASFKHMTRVEADTLDEVIMLVEQSQREMRTTAYLLHPPLLEEMGLPSALRWYAVGAAKLSGLRIDVDIPANLETWRASGDCEMALFRIAQEAIVNATRHSGCGLITVSLTLAQGASSDNPFLRLSVLDDGGGLPVDFQDVDDGNWGAVQLGVGIMGMYERVRQLEGRLTVRNRVSASGTVVEATIPSKTPPPEDEAADHLSSTTKHSCAT